MKWLQGGNILVGYTDQRGPAWWYVDMGLGLPAGTHFPGAIPANQVTRLLDVRLAKGTAFVQYKDRSGNKQVVEDKENFPIINQDTGRIFGYPKDGYTIHPYLPVLKGFMEQIFDDDTVGIGSAGLLRKGGVAFLQAVMPETYEVAGYGYVPYFTAVTSADRTKKTTHGTGILGAVCDNTVNSSILGAFTQSATRHSRNSLPTVEAIRNKLGIQLSEVGDKAAEGIENLLKVDVSERQFGRWLDKMVPLLNDDGTPKTKNGLTIAEKRRDQFTELWTTDPKGKPWRGTAFGVLQVANTQDTWNGMVRGADGGRMERNYEHAMLGKTAESDTRALTVLSEVLRKKLVAA
jgi:phage/plasmid-like protein (TIGR03299 family)